MVLRSWRYIYSETQKRVYNSIEGTKKCSHTQSASFILENRNILWGIGLIKKFVLQMLFSMKGPSCGVHYFFTDLVMGEILRLALFFIAEPYIS